MATCKETTDEVEGRGNGNPSMDVTMSDEITLNDGNDSDGNVTDSSTDSETTPGRGIDVIVHYKNKLRKQLLDFKKPLYIPLTLEKYLKWQFITNNSNLLQQRMTDLAKITEHVTIRKGILEVFLRRQKEHHDFDILAKTLEEILLSDTDSIAVSWFPLKASHQGTEFLQVLNRVVQHSDLANELYIEMTDTLNSKVIRFVHNVKILDRAKEITNQAVHEFEKQLLSNWHSINIDLPIVYSHIFEKYEMKRRVKTVSPTVLVFLDIMESKDKLNVELRGQQKDLNRVQSWIEELFIDPYCCLELGFDEVQMCEESIDIPSVITNTLERNNYQDLFWTISTHSKKTWICSAKGDDAHEALQVVKKCINQTKESKKTAKPVEEIESIVNQTKESKKTTKPVEEIESIVEELVSVHGDILGRSVSVRVLAEDDKDLAIYLTGDEHQLAHINNWFDSYTHSTTDVDTYAATKQDAYFIHGSDQSRTQSDPTSSSKLIQGTSQASSPIVPATEKAVVEDPLTGLSPKTGSPKRVKHVVCDVAIRPIDDIEPNLPAKSWPSRDSISQHLYEIEEGELWLVINIGTVETKPSEAEHHRLRDRVIDKMLLEMDDFEINSFPTTGIDKTKASELMMEKSAKEIRHELWLHTDDDSEHIHYIYPKTRGKDVDEIVKTVTDMPKIGKRKFELDLVLSKVFEHFNVRNEVKKRYGNAVTLGFDYFESKDKCQVVLEGKLSDLNDSESFIRTRFVGDFTINKVSFSDVKELEQSHNVERIVSDLHTKDAFIKVNDICKKISICSKTTVDKDTITHALKNCLLIVKFSPKYQQMIEKTEPVCTGTATVKMKDNELEIVGTSKAIEIIKQQVNGIQMREKDKLKLDHDQFGEEGKRDGQCLDGAVGNMQDIMQNKRHNTSKLNENTEMTQEMTIIVEESDLFERLCSSPQLRDNAKQKNVSLHEFQSTKAGFFCLSGLPENCLIVKKMIHQLLDEYKDKISSTETKATNIVEHKWDLKAGHRVQSSKNYSNDAYFNVHIDTVSPELDPSVSRERQPTSRNSPSLHLSEPGNQSMGERREGVTVNLGEQKAARNKEERLEGKTDNYVLIKSIPQDYTEDDIKAEVWKLCAVEFDLMFLPGSTEAMLKCKKKGDTKKLTGKLNSKILITEFPKQSLSRYRVEIKVDVKTEVKDALRNMDIHFSTVNGISFINAPTKYQLDWAVFKLTNEQKTRIKKDSASFEEIVPCTEDVWDIVSTKKMKNIQNLEKEGQKVKYTDGTVTYSGVNATSDDSHIMVLTSYIKEIQKMVIDKISINETNDDTINGRCEEIENNRNRECCVYVKGRSAVFAFSKLYDHVQEIKHQVSVKDGQIKVTGRRGLNLKDASNEAIVQKAIEEKSGRDRLESNKSDGNDKYQKRNETNRPKERDVQSHNPEFDLKRQAKNLQEYTTDENIKVYVYEANILKLPVDCIVNVANDTLQHGGGVARVIAQAAGRRLDKEGFDYIDRHGLVPVGKACVTTAGKLHYHCVIHAVGPRWSDYSPHSYQDVRICEKHLYSALMESFIAAEEQGLKSIALPAISAAIFAVPEEVCVYHYAKATIEYSRKRSRNALEEIHFIDINPSIVRKIQKMFTTILKDHNDPHYSTEKYVKKQRANNSKTFQSPDRKRNTSPTRDPVRHRQSPGGKPIKNTADADATFSPVYYKDGEIHVLQTELCKLMIKSGDIMHVKADAIVSIEDTNGSGKGKIAKLISDKMNNYNRYKLVSDRKWTFQAYTKQGDVYCTMGYDSGFRYILHAVVPYDIRNSFPAERKDVIKQTLTNILKKLSDRMIYSVVMCLIGTGKENKDDVQIAADAFIQVYKEYCKKPKGYSSKPLQITLVCRTKDMLDTVMKTFQHFGVFGSSADTPPAVPPRPGKNQTPESEDVGHDPHGLDDKASLEDCVICMDKITDRKVLKCGHAFDKECIDQYFKVKKVCPTCGAVCGVITGDQPKGDMFDRTERWNHCAGYEECGRISINYTFLGGNQGTDHPNPGKWYKGMTRIAYLPDNQEGREVLEMLKIAFKRRVTFTIGSSRTTGEEGVITWNDIHHKTDPKPNTQFGYPDPTYLDRVKDELSAKGITPKDI